MAGLPTTCYTLTLLFFTLLVWRERLNTVYSQLQSHCCAKRTLCSAVVRTMFVCRWVAWAGDQTQWSNAVATQWRQWLHLGVKLMTFYVRLQYTLLPLMLYRLVECRSVLSGPLGGAAGSPISTCVQLWADQQREYCTSESPIEAIAIGSIARHSVTWRQHEVSCMSRDVTFPLQQQQQQLASLYHCISSASWFSRPSDWSSSSRDSHAQNQSSRRHSTLYIVNCTWFVFSRAVNVITHYIVWQVHVTTYQLQLGSSRPKYFTLIRRGFLRNTHCEAVKSKKALSRYCFWITVLQFNTHIVLVT